MFTPRVWRACARLIGTRQLHGSAVVASIETTTTDAQRPFVVALTGGGSSCLDHCQLGSLLTVACALSNVAGPCGGKSTAVAMLSKRLSALGYAVFIVPETATLMITGGANFAGVSADQLR